MTTITAQVGPITVYAPPPPPGPLARRFGFDYIGIGGLIVRGYTANQFFDGMFLTPPYPSTVNLHISAQGTEFSQTNMRNFMATLMSRASAYPNIKLGLNLGFNGQNEQKWAELDSYLTFLRARPDWATIGRIGVFEFWYNLSEFPNSTTERAALARMQAMVEGRGWQFIGNAGGRYGSGGYTEFSWIRGSNYPDGDTQNLGWGDSRLSNSVGVSVGTDGHKIFPSPGCNSFNGFPEWSVVALPLGFLPPAGTPGTFSACRENFPPTIRQVLSSFRDNPLANRQWNYITAGNNAADHLDSSPFINFIGASGRSTYFLWDHPGFRGEMNNWINENPGVFLQGAI
mgnify:CR=1 FL=1